MAIDESNSMLRFHFRRRWSGTIGRSQSTGIFFIYNVQNVFLNVPVLKFRKSLINWQNSASLRAQDSVAIRPAITKLLTIN